MNLVWFLTIGTILMGLLGEFGQFPFGSTSSVSLLDLGSVLTIGFLAVWQLGVQRKIAFPKAIWWLVGFELCGLLGLTWNAEWSGLIYWLRFGVYSLWVWVGYQLIRSKVIRIEDWHNLLVVAGVIMLIGGVFQLIFLADLHVLEGFGFDPHVDRMTGLFLDPNFFGALLGIAWIVVLNRFLVNKDNRDLWLVIAIGSGIILSLSRSAYLMMVVMVVLLALWKSKKLLIVALIVITLVLVAVPRVSQRVVGGLSVDASSRERIESWQKGVRIWQINPVIGIGFNNIRAVGQKNGWVKVFSSNGGNSGAGVDSSLLVVLATTGIIGLGAFGGFWLIVAKKCWNDPQSYLLLVVMVGLFMESWFVNSLFLPLVMVWSYGWAGMILAKD